jgi:hypothetical protein
MAYNAIGQVTMLIDPLAPLAGTRPGGTLR